MIQTRKEWNKDQTTVKITVKCPLDYNLDWPVCVLVHLTRPVALVLPWPFPAQSLYGAHRRSSSSGLLHQLGTKRKRKSPKCKKGETHFLVKSFVCRQFCCKWLGVHLNNSKRKKVGIDPVSNENKYIFTVSGGDTQTTNKGLNN